MIGEYLTKACVQYNDYTGTVAGDLNYPHISLKDFITKLGFDDKTYFPFSIQLEFGELHSDGKRNNWIVISAVKVDEVGSNITDIIAYANEHGEVPTYHFNCNIEPKAFFDLFKRFNITLGFQSVSGHNYHDTIVENIIQEISI